LLKTPHDLQDTLHRRDILQRVQVGHLRQAGQLFVDLWVVFHGAGALTDIGVDIRSQGLLREAQVMAQHQVL